MERIQWIALALLGLALAGAATAIVAESVPRLEETCRTIVPPGDALAFDVRERWGDEGERIVTFETERAVAAAQIVRHRCSFAIEEKPSPDGRVRLTFTVRAIGPRAMEAAEDVELDARFVDVDGTAYVSLDVRIHGYRDAHGDLGLPRVSIKAQLPGVRE